MTRSRSHRRIKLLFVVLAILAGLLPAAGLRPLTAHAAGCDAWMDTSKTPEQRADALLSVMTTAQKDQLLVGTGNPSTNGAADLIAAQPSLCIPPLVFNDGGEGVSDFQQLITAYPAAISDAAMWDPSLDKAFGQSVGSEAFQKDINVWLAPGIDIGRVPMNGRNYEYSGEDPYLAGQTAAGVVQGVQSQNVIATLKHYAANDQETNRQTESDQVDERVLQEIDLPAFAAAVQQGGAGAVMCGYNRINRIYACENADTLTNDLKGELGFGGFVMSDWGGTHSTVNAANAGLDQEHPSSTHLGTALETAVANGQVSQARFDNMAYRVLYAMFRSGLFDHPIPTPTAPVLTNVDSSAARQVAQEMSEQGTVLLKNQGNVLPLSGLGAGKTIAVIGEPALSPRSPMTYTGAGMSGAATGTPNVVAPCQAITARAQTAGDTVACTTGDVAGYSDAVAAATAAHATGGVAIVYGYYQEQEGSDINSLELPNDQAGNSQDGLIQAVAATGAPTIVVLNAGGPVLMPWISQVAGVVDAWYPGEEDGNAIAALLFGDVNPSGHLPETFPLSMSDLPTAGNPAQYPGVTVPGDTVGPEVSHSEGLNVGYRWYDDTAKQVLFPFGYGLSYTTFRYSNYQLTGATTPGGTATVAFDVTNTGSVAGATVAQVYVGSPADNYVNEPLHQLRAFQKTGVLAPQETQHVTLSLDSTSVSYWEATSHSWQPENGCHPVWVGGSSRDIELQGSGLNGDLSLAVDCAATVSTYTGSVANVPESPSSALLLTPAGIAFVGAALLRRHRRRRGTSSTA